MKPEAQRIAIAEACGVSIYGHWRCPSCNREVSPSFVTFAETHDGCGHPVEWLESPDYLTDLNAMHEAENVLLQAGKAGDWRGWDSYRTELEERIGSDDAFHATAAPACRGFPENNWEMGGLNMNALQFILLFGICCGFVLLLAILTFPPPKRR